MTEKKHEIDQDQFKLIKEHATQLKSDNTAKDALFKKFRQAFLLQWDESDRKKLKNTKLTLSTDPRNKVLGAVRLMIATDPAFNVAYSSKPAANDRIEKVLDYIWNQSGRIANMPIHYDLLLSALLYGEMHTAIISTADLVESAKQGKRGIERAERIAAQTPYLYDAWSAEGGYFERDILGLCGYYRESKVNVMQLKADFGDLLPTKTAQRKDYETKTLYTWYDTKYTCHWIDDGAIDLEEHGLPALPVCVQTVDGSNLFSKPEERTQPLLYGVIQSGLWNRQNLAMTVIYTLVQGMGISPIWKHTSPGTEPRDLKLDFDNLGGLAEMIQGESLEPMANKALIDPALRESFSLATEKIEESTLSAQTLGQPLAGSNANFSYLSLLSQSGRLPLIGPQKRGGWGIAGVAETTLAFMKHEGKKFKYGGLELSASEIPEDIQVEVKLDVSLPQDKLQLANIANMLTEGEDPIASHNWVRENILNMDQPDDMQKQILTEKAGVTRFMLYLQDAIKKMQAPPPPANTGKTAPPANEAPGTSSGVEMAPGQGEQVRGMSPVAAGTMPGPGQAEALPPENRGGA